MTITDPEDSPPNEPAPKAPDTLPAPPPEPELDDSAFARLERFLSQLRVETLAKADSVRDQLSAEISELARLASGTQSGLSLLFELQERSATETRTVVADAIKAGMAELNETLRLGLAELDRKVDKIGDEARGMRKAADTIFEGHHVKLAELDRRVSDVEEHPHLHVVNGNGSAAED